MDEEGDLDRKARELYASQPEEKKDSLRQWAWVLAQEAGEELGVEVTPELADIIMMAALREAVGNREAWWQEITREEIERILREEAARLSAESEGGLIRFDELNKAATTRLREEYGYPFRPSAE